MKRILLAEDEENIADFVCRGLECFGFNVDEVLNAKFTEITPDSKNPYKQMYVGN